MEELSKCGAYVADPHAGAFVSFSVREPSPTVLTHSIMTGFVPLLLQ